MFGFMIDGEKKQKKGSLNCFDFF